MGNKIILSILILISFSLHAGDMRIAIVGAGPSGLMAAHTLKKLGYKDVTIFEKEGQVGGKVHTFIHQGKAFDMGAVILADNYKSVIDLAYEFDVPLTPFPTILNFLDENGEITKFLDEQIFKHGLLKLLGAVLHYKTLTKKYFGIYQDLALAHPALFENFTIFAKRNHIEPLVELFRPFVTGSGYGYPEEVPALYVMKLVSWPLVMALFNSYLDLGESKILYFKEGYQNLFNQMASPLNINFNSRVTGIERIPGNDGTTTIYLTANGKTHIFDKVIISTSPKTALNFIDAGQDELELFQKIDSYRYISAAVQIEGFNKSFFFKNNFDRTAFGKVLLLLHLHPKTDLFVSYQFADWHTDEDTDQILIYDIEQRGGTVKDILYKKEWDYFPHFKKNILKEKPYKKLNRMQGKRATYYVGGLLSFETVNDVLSYAEKLMRKNF